MSNPERGTKRTDPDTGKKFYDLNQDPVVSPYTGKSYPLSFFEQAMTTAKAAPERARPKAEVAEVEEEEVEETTTTTGDPEIVSLEEAEPPKNTDDDDDDDDDDIPEVAEVEVEEELGDDDDDAFLEEEDDDDDDFDIDVPSDDDR